MGERASSFALNYIRKAAAGVPRDLASGLVSHFKHIRPTVLIYNCTFVCDARCTMCNNWKRGDRKSDMTLAQLDAAGVRPEARYVVIRCADTMEGSGELYYESLDLEDAYHEQTILAYEMNDQALPVAQGAPLRLRVERPLQLVEGPAADAGPGSRARRNARPRIQSPLSRSCGDSRRASDRPRSTSKRRPRSRTTGNSRRRCSRPSPRAGPCHPWTRYTRPSTDSSPSPGNGPRSGASSS